MTHNDLDSVYRRTTARPSSCQCVDCQAMCATCPCLGTPSDIAQLLDAGHGDDLTPTIWYPPGAPESIEMVQLRQTNHGCVRFRNGRCSINALKPTEGVLASHKNRSHLADSPSIAVALTWLLPRNRKLVAHLIRVFTQPYAPAIHL